ncbi:Hypothetical protein CINCED_3A019080 [Cinara cedri]|uniref:Uncharacterized protein n=1 Tax=Cinara cedri TaxID=506608 RepID=A0A5E4MUC1_9HEMI|nr:Hypothetical protein CINCED_3A019080 [Cinara cedri]
MKFKAFYVCKEMKATYNKNMYDILFFHFDFFIDCIIKSNNINNVIDFTIEMLNSLKGMHFDPEIKFTPPRQTFSWWKIEEDILRRVEEEHLIIPEILERKAERLKLESKKAPVEGRIVNMLSSLNMLSQTEDVVEYIKSLEVKKIKEKSKEFCMKC